ncbi:MAG: hypothetical protein IKB88_02060 [Clostridia bacterium]|nr:hypothetical protein [Clostridia bacterium]
MNHIEINGIKIELNEAQTKQLAESFALDCKQKRLADYSKSEAVRIGESEFIVLEQENGRTYLLLKGLLTESTEFGTNNYYDGSNVDEICNDFAVELMNAVGEENVLPFTVDLTANDGLKCYGTIERRAALLTAEQYRKYVYIIDEQKLDKWWWLATPFSTAKHNDTECALCVSPDGIMSYYGFNNSVGVRPFCILNSNIFVSD